jgi:hypothetical protein
LRSRRYFDGGVTFGATPACNVAALTISRARAMPDDDVSLEDLIAIERIAQELWERATKGTPLEWQSMSVLAKQAWRSRARMEVTIWRKSVGEP